MLTFLACLSFRCSCVCMHGAVFSDPLGIIYDKAELEAVLRWASDKGIHVIVDEIYANCVFDPISVSEAASNRFISCSYFLMDGPSPVIAPSHLHCLYGMSKDFGMSGYRVGWLYTGNDAVIEAWQNLGYFVGVSNDVQSMCTQLLHNTVGPAAP